MQYSDLRHKLGLLIKLKVWKTCIIGIHCKLTIWELMENREVTVIPPATARN